MFKRKNNKKGIVAMAGAMAITGGMFAQATPAYAENTIQDGTTPVTYDNRTVLPDSNGEYGMIIPTAISFTDDNATAKADIEITGINGYDLDNDWQDLTVKAKVKSEKGFQLQLDGEIGKYATYSLSYDMERSDAGTDENTIIQKLGVGRDKVKKVDGTATLEDKTMATTKGQYKDKLIYSFTEEANEKKK